MCGLAGDVLPVSLPPVPPRGTCGAGQMKPDRMSRQQMQVWLRHRARAVGGEAAAHVVSLLRSPRGCKSGAPVIASRDLRRLMLDADGAPLATVIPRPAKAR